MNKLITVTMITSGVLFSNPASADPGHLSPIEPTYSFLHFFTSADHMLPLSGGIAIAMYFGIKKWKKARNENTN